MVDEDNNIELKPCPFCGGKAETHNEVDVNPIHDLVTGAYVDADINYYEQTGCPACDVWFYIGEDEPEGTTIEKWNRRVESTRRD